MTEALEALKAAGTVLAAILGLWMIHSLFSPPLTDLEKFKRWREALRDQVDKQAQGLAVMREKSDERHRLRFVEGGGIGRA